MELLNNALIYSDGDLEISLSDSGEIIFMNTAEALDQVQARKLFDRFFTVETASHSTGLGLAISKTLVERMGGSISAQYQAGKLVIAWNFNRLSCGGFSSISIYFHFFVVCIKELLPTRQPEKPRQKK